MPQSTEEIVLSPSPEQQQFNESLAQVATATMMAQSLSACLERKHLVGIQESENYSLKKNAEENNLLFNIKWIKINQIGCPINNNFQACFDAMQNILHSCSIPKTKLLFLIFGDGHIFNLFMGLQGDSELVMDFQTDVCDFVNTSWNGVSCKAVKEKSKDFETIKSYVKAKFESVHAITGIPTLNLQTGYPGTVEYLMGGNRNKTMAYLVVAEPMDEQEIDKIIFSCNEMQGQAESMKSFSLSESMQFGKNETFTEGRSETISASQSFNRSEMKGGICHALTAGALLALGLNFPPMIPFISAIGINADSLFRMAGLGLGMLAAITPRESEGNVNGTAQGKNTAHGEGTSESYSKSITKNLVNAHIEYVVEHLKKQKARYEEGKAIGMWNVSSFLFSNSGSYTGPLQLKSILSGTDSKYEPIRIHDISELIGGGLHSRNSFTTPPDFSAIIKSDDNREQLYEHPFGYRFNGLTTLLTTKELTCLANFPLHSVPGINVVDATAGFSLTEQKLTEEEPVVDLGKLLWTGSSTDISVKLPINTLSRHALVCGVNGSGKTNTVLSILDGFMKADKPFFVIEPAKTEYVDWAIKYNESIKNDPTKKKIKIFIPGCEKYAKSNFIPPKLKINPFEVIQLPGSEMRVLSHIDRLKSTFASAFPMQDILPVIMEHLLYDLYTKDNEDIDHMTDGFPTLNSIGKGFIKQLMEDKIGYAPENTQNISAALRTRFKSLKMGWKGELLNNKKLTDMSWDDLFKSQVVVNLSYAGDDQDRAFIMSLLLQFLYEYRIAESEAGRMSFDANECRHLVVVEEAHRVMGICENPESPQYKSGLMFSNFLSEVRAYGQGMMVVDQVPTRLIEDAIKNTNVKIIHKLVADDDSKKVAECIGLTEEQQRVIAKLSIGQAVLAGFNSANVMSENSSDVYLAQIIKMK